MWQEQTPATASCHGWSLLQPFSARVAVCRSYGAKTVFTFSMLQTCRPDGAIVLILIHVPKLLSPISTPLNTSPRGREMFFVYYLLPTFCPYGAIRIFISIILISAICNLPHNSHFLIRYSLFVTCTERSRNIPYSNHSKICRLTVPMLYALCPLHY